MPLQIDEFPANPECLGQQWGVLDDDLLADVVAQVLVGKARHAARVINGAEGGAMIVGDALKEKLHSQLVVPPGAQPYHRDGLLFEAICWVAARMSANANDLISDPHLQATQQGTDLLKIAFANDDNQLVGVTIYEQKCTTAPRNQFRDHVLPAFVEYASGSRDNQIVQSALSLFALRGLPEAAESQAYARIVIDRPFIYSAGMTVTPDPFSIAMCRALFDGFPTITPNVENRMGNTFPLDDVRQWFCRFRYIGFDKNRR